MKEVQVIYVYTFDAMCFAYDCLYEMNEACTNKLDDIIPVPLYCGNIPTCPKYTVRTQDGTKTTNSI